MLLCDFCLLLLSQSSVVLTKAKYSVQRLHETLPHCLYMDHHNPLHLNHSLIHYSITRDYLLSSISSWTVVDCSTTVLHKRVKHSQARTTLSVRLAHFVRELTAR